MHDIEPQLAQWRKSLSPGLTPIAREELESHLRELVEAELRKGVPVDRAFQQAAQQLGDLAAISGEFQKIDRAFWWPLRAARWATLLMTVVLAAIFVSILLKNSAYPDLQLLLATHTFTISFGYLLTFLLGALALCFSLQRIFTPLNPAQTHSLAQAAHRLSIAATVLTATGIILGMVWADFAWGKAWSWDGKETGGLAVLAFLLFFTLRQPARSPQQSMLLLLLGNIVVASAWFQSSLWIIGLTTLLSLLGLYANLKPGCRTRVSQ
jgi:hypothetical protein